MASWSPPWSGKSPRRLGRVGVQCRGCIGGFLCLVSDFKMVKGTYLLSIVGSLQLGFTTRFLPPKFFGTFFSPTSGRRDGPQLRFTHRSYPSTLFKTDWLVDMQWFYYAFWERFLTRNYFCTESSESNPNRVEVWDVEFSSFVPALDMSDFSTKHSQSLKIFQIFGANSSPNNEGIFQQKTLINYQPLTKVVYDSEFGSATVCQRNLGVTFSARASGRLMRRGHLDTPAGDGSIWVKWLFLRGKLPPKTKSLKVYFLRLVNQ